MDDEIKEILEQLEWYRKIGKKDLYYPERVLTNKKAFLLLDYITNLQQENETLHENNQNMQEEMARVWEENERLKEEHNQLRNCRKYDLNLISNLKQDKVRYKEIIDKAIEYINGNKHTCNYVDIYNYALREEDLLNILQNGSEEK